MALRNRIWLFVSLLALAACKNRDEPAPTVSITTTADGGAVTVQGSQGSVTVQNSPRSEKADEDDDDDDSKKPKGAKGPVIKQSNGGSIRVNPDGTITVQGTKEGVTVGGK